MVNVAVGSVSIEIGLTEIDFLYNDKGFGMRQDKVGREHQVVPSGRKK